MNSQMSNLRAGHDCVIFISLDGDLWCEERWLQQCWDSEIVWEWECCIVNLIIILLWRNIRELVSSAVQASDQSVDHVWPSFAGLSWDETEPARIDNEPGVATAECRANSWYITHCRHQTPVLQCCSQLLQITPAPYSHYCRGQSTGIIIIIQQTRGDVRRQLISFPWPNSGDICHWPVSGGRSLSSLSLSYSSLSLSLSDMSKSSSNLSSSSLSVV